MNVQHKMFAPVGILILIATVSLAQEVKTDYDRNANFGQYKTYSWENVQTQDALLVDRVKTAVNAALRITQSAMRLILVGHRRSRANSASAVPAYFPHVD